MNIDTTAFDKLATYIDQVQGFDPANLRTLLENREAVVAQLQQLHDSGRRVDGGLAQSHIRDQLRFDLCPAVKTELAAKVGESVDDNYLRQVLDRRVQEEMNKILQSNALAADTEDAVELNGETAPSDTATTAGLGRPKVRPAANRLRVPITAAGCDAAVVEHVQARVQQALALAEQAGLKFRLSTLTINLIGRDIESDPPVEGSYAGAGLVVDFYSDQPPHEIAGATLHELGHWLVGEEFMNTERGRYPERLVEGAHLYRKLSDLCSNPTLSSGERAAKT
ncbi:hypothetical protein ACFL6C_14135, partial [Myxococcota bacterium]